jgi:uncharacterized membrane protein YuzA (DUF378 family)
MIIDKLLFGGELEDGEEIIYVIHRHWVLVYMRYVKVVAVGILLPFSLLYFLFGFQSTVSWVLYVWIGIAVLVMLYDFVDWYGDAWVLTNERIIDVRWDGFFKHSGVTLDWGNMLDVEYEVKGIRQRLWGYGTMSINKYAGMPIEVKNVNKPKEAANTIAKLRLEFLAKHKKGVNQIKDVLTELIQDRISHDPKYADEAIDDESISVNDRYG